MSRGYKETILCVDDVADNLTLLADELEDEGYVVLVAENGETALELMSKEKPGAVLLDWQMPGMSGLEVLKKIRESHGPLEVPVIMVTAQRARGNLATSFDLGANDFVEKPIDFPILLARMRAHLRLCYLLQERDQLIKRLDALSRTDALTNVLNRRAFDEQGDAMFSYARRRGLKLSVVLFDADHFKSINDQFGHKAGDCALQAIADCLCRSRRKEDLLARIGGEEFALICPSTTGEEACALAQRCGEEIRETSIVGLAPHRYVSLSAGVCELDARHENFAQLLHDADASMYRAKRSGRDRVCLFRAPAGDPWSKVA